MTTADERVERVGCIVKRSEMEEGLLYCFSSKREKLQCPLDTSKKALKMLSHLSHPCNCNLAIRTGEQFSTV